MRARRCFLVPIAALFIFGCTSVKPTVTDRPVTPTTTRPDQNVESPPPTVMRRRVTLEWNCEVAAGEVTGIVSAPSPAGPWSLECRFPAQAANTWSDTNVTRQAKFYRAFTDWENSYRPPRQSR